MNFSTYADYPQGLVLPKFGQRCTLMDVKGLSTLSLSWWTKHPTAQKRHVGQSVFFRIFSNALDLFGGRVPNSERDGGAKNALNPQGFLCGPMLCASLSTYILTYRDKKQMIYTFLIAGGARTCALSDLKRIRNISTVANTEQQAREQLNGLKLVFISRVRGGASC